MTHLEKQKATNIEGNEKSESDEGNVFELCMSTIIGKRNGSQPIISF